MFKTISFYKYVPVESPQELESYCRILCTNLRLTGRILIALEGINAAISGKNEDVEEFKKIIIKTPCFSDLAFREQATAIPPHHKLVVRVRDEIVHFGEKVNMSKVGIPLSPSQLRQWYAEQQDFVVVDARNEYEHTVGKFKNAITLPLENFREFPAIAAKQLEHYKHTKMVLYCTGGVRCEKASAYLQEQGFEQVYQVEGGIINYVNQFPDSNSNWQGGLFVFDSRLVSDVGDPITQCQFCQKECEQYHHCFNLDCDKLFIACPDCVHQMNSTCSDECKKAPKQRKKDREMRKRVGTIVNYYSKAKVALMKVEQEINPSISLTVVGKTTPSISIQITQLRNEQGENIDKAFTGELVTFPVHDKVRKNDLVCISQERF